MRVERVLDHEEMSRRACAVVVAEVRTKPGLLLGVATGDTPTRTYERLAEVRIEEPALFDHCLILALDEWLGLPPGHPASCQSYLREKLLGPLRIPVSRYRGFRAQAKDPEAECRRMSRWLGRSGPMDVCILGLGRNGHLLMNEPGAALSYAPHRARLAESTRRHSMLTSAKTAPRFGLTLGLADVLQARRILLLVSGRQKRLPLRRMLAGQVSAACPASFLWLHGDVTVYCDRAAAP